MSDNKPTGGGMPTITIKHRSTGTVLYTHEATQERIESGLAMRDAMEKATASGADLYAANLSGANLYGALVRGLKLVGSRPFLAIGPIGSESRAIYIWLTESGVRVQAGCFFGSRDEFAAKVSETHGDNAHAQEYGACLPLIAMHAKLWMPAVEVLA